MMSGSHENQGKKIHPDAKIPSYAHHGDAGFDVCSCEDIVINPGERKIIRTGLAFEIPDGYVALVWDKSGLAKNHGITNLAGVIDCGFRGESCVLLYNVSEEPFIIEKGNKIAQVLIKKVERAEFEEVGELNETSRAGGGWGSTGIK
jgi:dUTP pyrophosphatase